MPFKAVPIVLDDEFAGSGTGSKTCAASPPENAVVYSVDETTGIQAKERRVTTTPQAPGRPARQEFEFVRHGTAGLLGGLEVTTGEVMATDIVRNNSVTLHFQYQSRVHLLEALKLRWDTAVGCDPPP